MAAPQHLLISTSSAWPEDDACPSTLRARLRDDATPATSSSINPIPYRNIYEQVHACLGSQLHAPKPEKEVPQAVKSHDPATQLREAYARMGMSLHTSAIEHLIQAHSEVQSKTMGFSEESSKALSQCKDLYSNIVYPLSATLCSSPDHPRASVAVHLNSLKRDIAAAKEEILRLQVEWDACCRTEAEAWKVLNEGLSARGCGPNEVDNNVVKAAKEFKKEAEAIVEDKCRLLTELDQYLKVEAHRATLKMMRDLFNGD
ncbi:hypothetical protein BKA59DRAFT_513691 [Fusarium tricinctum]|uniref:Uncharacterized protein n=1 Tax=Fusarium tricinctum TaxID=61284 RepID=A0A8K0RW56_9HYPO|nr:hypothetical protein BKA59DRAFT_513691 [Fusarium tricinctum]